MDDKLTRTPRPETVVDTQADSGNELVMSTSEHPRVQQPETGEEQHQDEVGGDEPEEEQQDDEDHVGGGQVDRLRVDRHGCYVTEQAGLIARGSTNRLNHQICVRAQGPTLLWKDAPEFFHFIL
ncbi:hypothetical protein SFRURICE_004221 [Spodoptera frugiperda]|uniref:SFRICE_023503 n=1 Tax=Spodoptera frugiperda TaxID=7108 RepID=A0A2H1VU90_SPOFR|nr:hypothetical protein SFRURICE_004221 [Spodoptera frugiperda]